jgi:hypothetical protein
VISARSIAIRSRRSAASCWGSGARGAQARRRCPRSSGCTRRRRLSRRLEHDDQDRSKVAPLGRNGGAREPWKRQHLNHAWPTTVSRHESRESRASASRLNSTRSANISTMAGAGSSPSSPRSKVARTQPALRAFAAPRHRLVLVAMHRAAQRAGTRGAGRPARYAIRRARL